MEIGQKIAQKMTKKTHQMNIIISIIIFLTFFSFFRVTTTKEYKYASILPSPYNITYGTHPISIYPDSFEILIKNEEKNLILEKGVERLMKTIFPFTNSQKIAHDEELKGFTDLNLFFSFFNILLLLILL